MYEVEEQHWSEEEFEDTKRVIRIRKLKKDRQHNDQKKRDRQCNSQKKKDRQHNYQKVITVDHFPVSDSILKLYGFPTFL
jgi:hypothetical protein